MPIDSFSRRLFVAGACTLMLAAPVLAQSSMGRSFTAYSPAAFDKALKSAEPTIVHIHAPWCSVCKAQEGAFSKLTTSDPVFKTAQLVRVDFDTDKAFLKEHRVTNQSVIIVFRNGKEVTRLAGESNPDRIKAAVSAAAM